ncbi:MAG: flagellar biosynthetic protein FliO [Bryobacteraceae bacterium]|nr:flagellar biosynthetic protein FliO [Bryobacteraceae bacterium]
MAGVVLVAAVLGLWLYGRWSSNKGWTPFSRAKGNRVMEAVGSLALTPQHSLHAVRAGGELLILAAHATGVRVVRVTRLPGREVCKESRREEITA